MINPCGEIVIGKKQYCTLGLIPNYIPEEQWGDYLYACYEKEVSPDRLPRVRD